MKTGVLTFVLIFGTVMCVFSQDADKEAIKKVVQNAYIDGLINNGDQQAIEAGFHPGFNLLGIGEGDRMWKRPIYDWAADAEMRKQRGELPRVGDQKVTLQFLNIDVEGTAAVAKIAFYTGKTLSYIDFLSLYKFDSGWKIVSKIYYQIPKE